MTYTRDNVFGCCIQSCNPIKDYRNRHPGSDWMKSPSRSGKNPPILFNLSASQWKCKGATLTSEQMLTRALHCKFSKQLFPEWLPLMSELIHQINKEKQKGHTKLTSATSKKYPWLWYTDLAANIGYVAQILSSCTCNVSRQRLLCMQEICSVYSLTIKLNYGNWLLTTLFFNPLWPRNIIDMTHWQYS